MQLLSTFSTPLLQFSQDCYFLHVLMEKETVEMRSLLEKAEASKPVMSYRAKPGEVIQATQLESQQADEHVSVCWPAT